jgi:uncharacterized protein (DUF302 family)
MADDGLDSETGIVTKLSPRSVDDTVAYLVDMALARGMKLFAIVDHGDEARSVGLPLRDTRLVVLGNPVAGTPLMDAAPLSGLDLPQRVLVWQDGGTTKISYYAPSALVTRHHLSADLAARLDGIHALTDAVISPVVPVWVTRSG